MQREQMICIPIVGDISLFWRFIIPNVYHKARYSKGFRVRVYGLWFMVYGLWFMVYGLWFHGSWFHFILLLSYSASHGFYSHIVSHIIFSRSVVFWHRQIVWGGYGHSPVAFCFTPNTDSLLLILVSIILTSFWCDNLWCHFWCNRMTFGICSDILSLRFKPRDRADLSSHLIGFWT